MFLFFPQSTILLRWLFCIVIGRHSLFPPKHCIINSGSCLLSCSYKLFWTNRERTNHLVSSWRRLCWFFYKSRQIVLYFLTQALFTMLHAALIKIHQVSYPVSWDYVKTPIPYCWGFPCVISSRLSFPVCISVLDFMSNESTVYCIN